ncbi:serine hydrolase domain-containing protein [Streptomyces pactum]|uniref:serine hydrolase domain-containing protein n=1 Tax=Streptomyces pactum TaxID=68249 RepID=UPI003702A4EA
MRYLPNTSSRSPVPKRRSVRCAVVLAAASALAAVAAPAPAAGRPATAPTAAPAGCDQARGALTASLDTLVARHGTPGVAAEVTDPRCGRWSVARGVADLDSGRPMRAADRLRIGSVSKTFTATVVVQLAAEGRLRLDDPVERHLPGLIRGDGHDGRTITVRQLLQHTSGIADYVDAIGAQSVETWRYRHFEPRELVELGLKLPRPQGPWHYSTTNTVLAGLIVEKVTGRGVEAEVTRRIIRPLGLRDTYWPGDATRIRGAHSRSYFPADADTRPGPDGTPLADGTAWNMTFGGAGGALVSSPADVNRFFRALFGGELVPASLLAEMKRTVPADPERLWPGARYGLGLIASPLSCGGMWWGHGGTVPGGHRALGATGPGGRGVALALTRVPHSEQAEQDFRTAVDTALCATGPNTHQSKENM